MVRSYLEKDCGFIKKTYSTKNEHFLQESFYGCPRATGSPRKRHNFSYFKIRITQVNFETLVSVANSQESSQSFTSWKCSGCTQAWKQIKRLPYTKEEKGDDMVTTWPQASLEKKGLLAPFHYKGECESGNRERLESTTLSPRAILQKMEIDFRESCKVCFVAHRFLPWSPRLPRVLFSAAKVTWRSLTLQSAPLVAYKVCGWRVAAWLVRLQQCDSQGW